jgi:hypothetical protein
MSMIWLSRSEDHLGMEPVWKKQILTRLHYHIRDLAEREYI